MKSSLFSVPAKPFNLLTMPDSLALELGFKHVSRLFGAVIANFKLFVEDVVSVSLSPASEL